MVIEHKERIIEYDLIRTAAIFAVVLIHCIYFSVFVDFTPSSLTWMTSNIIDAAMHWCVPVFIMISGALLVRKGFDTARISYFYRTKALRVVMPFVIWLAIYFLWYAAVESKAPFAVDANHALRSLISGHPVGPQLYFLLIIIGLYTVTPLISLLCDKLSNKQIATTAILLTLLSSMSYLINRYLGLDYKGNMLTLFVPYIGYYLLGYTINLYRLELKSRINGVNVFLLYIVTSLIIAMATYILVLPTGKFNSLLYEYNSPLIVLSSAAVFIGLMKLSDYLIKSKLIEELIGVKYSSTIRKLSDLSYGVFLVHILVLDSLLLIFPGFRDSANHVLTAMVTFIIVIAASLILTGIYKYQSSMKLFKVIPKMIKRSALPNTSQL